MHDFAQKLVHYHAWANRKMLEHLKTLPAEVFLTEVNSVFPTISHTFGHMAAVDEVWLSRIKQVTPKQISANYFKEIADAEQAFNEVNEKFNQLLGEEKDVLRRCTYQNTKGEAYEQSILEMIQHVVNHGTYHRGNIAAMLRQMGYQGTSTDYIVFLRTI